jgi:hypothetical protein
MTELEDDDDREAVGDDEPSLGSFDRMTDQSKSWRQGHLWEIPEVDAEQDDADAEPALGSLDQQDDQQRWAEGGGAIRSRTSQNPASPILTGCWSRSVRRTGKARGERWSDGRENPGIDATQSNLLHSSQRKRRTRCLCWRPVPGLSCRTSGTASLRRSRRRRWFGSAVANAPDPAAGQPFLNPALLGYGQSRRVAAGVMRKAVAVSQPGGGFSCEARRHALSFAGFVSPSFRAF